MCIDYKLIIYFISFTDFAIANVTCEYDTSRSPSPSHPITSSNTSNEDHNYQLHSSDSCEPPAFIITQVIYTNCIINILKNDNILLFPIASDYFK